MADLITKITMLSRNSCKTCNESRTDTKHDPAKLQAPHAFWLHLIFGPYSMTPLVYGATCDAYRPERLGKQWRLKS